MRRIIPGTDAEILARVARRRALNERAAQAEQAARRKALRRHIRQRCVALGIDVSLLDDDAASSTLMHSLAVDFVYAPDPDDEAAIDAAKAEARAVLSDTIKSERWTVGDCGCVLERVYHRDTPEDSQTFNTAPCASHAGMAIDALHDTIEDETLRRSSVHRYLHEHHGDVLCATSEEGALVDLPDAISFAWEGQRRKRILRVRAPALTPAQRDALIAWADATFGRREIGGVETSIVQAV